MRDHNHTAEDTLRACRRARRYAAWSARMLRFVGSDQAMRLIAKREQMLMRMVIVYVLAHRAIESASNELLYDDPSTRSLHESLADRYETSRGLELYEIGSNLVPSIALIQPVPGEVWMPEIEAGPIRDAIHEIRMASGGTLNGLLHLVRRTALDLRDTRRERAAIISGNWPAA